MGILLAAAALTTALGLGPVSLHRLLFRRHPAWADPTGTAAGTASDTPSNPVGDADRVRSNHRPAERTRAPPRKDHLMHVVAFIVAMAIFVFGFWLFGLAFAVTAWQAPIFFAGILCVSLGFAIPVQILRK